MSEQRALIEKIRDLSEELGRTKDPYQIYRIAGDLDAVTKELHERRRAAKEQQSTTYQDELAIARKLNGCWMDEATQAKIDRDELRRLAKAIQNYRHIGWNPPETEAIVTALPALLGELDTATTALAKINTIRNSIVGTQTVNWSAHVYPLVAALNEAGLKGQSYEDASAEARTFVGQIRELTADRAAANQRIKAAEARIVELDRRRE